MSESTEIKESDWQDFRELEGGIFQTHMIREKAFLRYIELGNFFGYHIEGKLVGYVYLEDIWPYFLVFLGIIISLGTVYAALKANKRHPKP